ncbi:hypothetical protein JKF63_06303 [Porcisia hertigi]|uniref:Uncharacterized protein n=1 Tax=Porcisia hertigi TaxID=2761500 RepID=A0A836IUA6_9TRYP|nr:hypothetical protein JKF63_06303 [Porcisia hertigi]
MAAGRGGGGVSRCVAPVTALISTLAVATRRCSSGLQCGSSAGTGCAASTFGDMESRLSERLGEEEAAGDEGGAAWSDTGLLPGQGTVQGVSRSSSIAFTPPASPASGPPQLDAATASGRAALDQRRRLFAQCRELACVVEEEMRAEVARDMKDGVAAVPPLAPSGWRVLHTTGSSYFTMSRLKKGCYMDSRAGGGRVDNDSDSPRAAPDLVPRYRSVHDLVTGSRQGPLSAGRGDAAAGREDVWVLHRGRYTAAQAGLAASKRSGPTGSEGGSGDHGDGRRRYAVRYARSDTHITLFAPFRSLDVTLYNPRVDICESARFDVLVRKECPKAAAAAAAALSSLEAATLEGQQEVWDEGRCMFVRLACVNDELRVRSLQFVSHKLARALEEHAVFGRGEPLYLELLRRLPMAASVHKSSPQRGSGAAASRDQLRTVSAASPVNVFDAPEPTSATPAAAAPPFSSAHVLTSQFDRSGEYARTFAYAGPYITELSKELREALSEYIMMDVGITNEVAEYVCQLQFFLEQEAYIGWLAQWGQLAATLKSAV